MYICREGINMKDKKSNSDLKKLYNKVYKEGEKNFFSKFVGDKKISEAEEVILLNNDFSGKRVLDVGCGTGLFTRLISSAGASQVVGLDYSDEAIREALSNSDKGDIKYVCSDIMSYQSDEKFDVIVSLGTIEHMDNPENFLAILKEQLNSDGSVILTCPHFINLRGFVWMALALLQDIPMSLSDLHFIHPWDMEAWAEKAGFKVEMMESFDNVRTEGDNLIRDYSKRLPNALRDAGISTDGVDKYMSYLKSLVEHLDKNNDIYQMDGASAQYRLKRI